MRSIKYIYLIIDALRPIEGVLTNNEDPDQTPQHYILSSGILKLTIIVKEIKKKPSFAQRPAQRKRDGRVHCAYMG